MTTIPVIHAVTTDEIVAQADFVERAAGVMRVLGARGAVHLRSAAATGRRLYELAAALSALQDSTGAWVIVNDRVDIAVATGARGVQLTSRSLATDDAARVARAAPAGTPIPALGVSVHAADEAQAAAASGAAAWIVVGHVFATPSHEGEPGRGESMLGAICGAVDLPVIGIGGVRPAHVSQLLAQGAYGVAAIRGIWRAVDAERAAADYLSAHDAVRDAQGSGGPDTGAVDSAGQKRRG